MPNRWTDQDQIWDMYTYSSGNGHRLNKIDTSKLQGVLGGGGG